MGSFGNLAISGQISGFLAFAARAQSNFNMTIAHALTGEVTP